jgi:thiol:disulfide interchange protein
LKYYLLNFFFFFLLMVTVRMAFCQTVPITWIVSSQKLDSNHYLITVKAITEKGWYIYAKDDTSNQITGIDISWANSHVLKSSELKKPDSPERIHDKIFNNRSLLVFTRDFVLNQSVQIHGDIPGNFKIQIHGFAANGKEFQPIDEERTIVFEGAISQNSNLSSKIKLSTVDLNNPKANCGIQQNTGKGSKGLLNLFLLGIAGGLIALVTPCVFPMIPVTVSFFTNKAKTKQQGIRNGMIYGFCILLIYLLASLPFHLIGNISPEILNSISTNAWVNIIFFVIFIFFALSFFGLFEIALPSGFANKTDSKSGAGSFIGIFFMALTLATVSFSCTGPILGSLLVGSLSANGGAWQLTTGMGGFGLALALPFGLFAMFPQWMKKLPKSGSWLDIVKKILAFLELALAFKFLSNADLVMHWGILKREIFIGIWFLISALLALYLLGFFENIFKSISRGRAFLGIMLILFTLYLIPGLTNSKYNNLKLLSGFAPPLSYSIYKNESQNSERLKPAFINDYAKALELSKSKHKPILIDFTGWACVNCRKMEEQVWTNPEISNFIKNNFILVSLYVDDRKKLDANESFTYKTKTGSDKDIITVGDKWATFQSENFGQVTQPLYVILNSDEQLMNLPVGYTPDITQYKVWLECGLSADVERIKN